MNKGSPHPFIGLRLQQNRTATGRRTSTPARRAAHYFAFGQDSQGQEEAQQRGQWLGADGRIHSHEAVLEWGKANALAHRYTGLGLLSVPQGNLAAPDFAQALVQHPALGDWRLVAHDDTAHAHAHVLFFGDRRLEKQTFLAWQTAVRAELTRLSQQQLTKQGEQQLALGDDAPRWKLDDDASGWEAGYGLE